MNLFDLSTQQQVEKQAPLAWRMRPRGFDEYVGQEHIVGPGKLLRRAIERDLLYSIILWGKPGTGKTALANVIASVTHSYFSQLNAVTGKISDIREIILEAQERRGMHKQKTVLFIDEIHRFNRAQQDALLPDVERGIITLIGATTYNPFFSVIPALVSRSQIFELRPLAPENLIQIIERTLRDHDSGLGRYNIELTPRARDHLIDLSNGDARKLLNALEIAALTAPADANGKILVTSEAVEEALQRKGVTYDDDDHYDVASAFIKSIRGGDADAALYWMARMIQAGEDPVFIARRLVISAAEDIGLGNPQALVLATAAMQAVQTIGLPEARIPLSEAVILLCQSPKSNSAYLAIDRALKDVEEQPHLPIPEYLRDPHRPGGHDHGYKYPHNYPGGMVAQDYLGAAKTFYEKNERDAD